MYDFIVVGSGASGGVLAHNLFEAGAKCLLLEAGKHFTAETFPKTEMDYSTQLYWGGGLELDSSAKMAFLRARCVGGTTVVNQCLLDRFDEIAFSDWKTASGIDFFNLDSMEPYYRQIEQGLVTHEFSNQDFTKNASLFIKGCEQLGYKWAPLHRGQTDCKLEDGNDCIGCLGGCHRDSKQSTLVTHIQKAEKNGLEILSEFMVEKVEHSAEHVKIFGVTQNEKRELLGRKVVLAGGSFGTSKILLNSGLGRQLPALGKNFCCHTQFMSFGIFDEMVDAHKGAFQTVASKDPSFREKGFKLENVFAPPISIAMLYPGSGAKHREFMKKYRHLACIEVAIRDEAVGKIAIDKKGKLMVEKELTAQDLKRRDDGLEVVNAIFESTGAREVVQSPFYFGLHLMGGCAVGSDPKQSVVNEAFQVHDFPNLYIADSSIFPNAPGINPSLTIMALAQKLSQSLAKT